MTSRKGNKIQSVTLSTLKNTQMCLYSLSKARTLISCYNLTNDRGESWCPAIEFPGEQIIIDNAYWYNKK